VLESIEAEVGDVRRLGVAVDGEDAALFVKLIVI
jgi:hypothetical protein